MSDENQDLEQHLARLSPLEQEPLAATILDAWQLAQYEHTSSAAPRYGCLARLSPASVLLGALLGAAATFLAMVQWIPPTVGIREVRVGGESVAEAVVRPGARQSTDGRASPAETGAARQAAEATEGRGMAGRQFATKDAMSPEIDELLAEYEARARRMNGYASQANFAPVAASRASISPDEYRELLRDLRL